jgi:hypothetical protein
MTRRFSPTERRRRLNARYSAMERAELREPSQERVSPEGATSAPMKKIDAETQALIDAAMKERSART